MKHPRKRLRSERRRELRAAMDVLAGKAMLIDAGWCKYVVSSAATISGSNQQDDALRVTKQVLAKLGCFDTSTRVAILFRRAIRRMFNEKQAPAE